MITENSSWFCINLNDMKASIVDLPLGGFSFYCKNFIHVGIGSSVVKFNGCLESKRIMTEAKNITVRQLYKEQRKVMGIKCKQLKQCKILEIIQKAKISSSSQRRKTHQVGASWQVLRFDRWDQNPLKGSKLEGSEGHFLPTCHEDSRSQVQQIWRPWSPLHTS